MRVKLSAIGWIASVWVGLAASPAYSAPNLTPYQPSGWSSKVVVSTTTGTSSDSGGLTVDHNLYVDWAVLNNGSSTAGSFQTQLYLDGGLRATWSTNSLNPNYYTYVSDYSLGKLSAGTHTLRIKTDSGGVVGESNEGDNEYTKTITVSGGKPNLTPYQPAGWSDEIVVSTTTGTYTDSSGLTVDHNLYVDWAVLNNGSNAAGTFQTQLFVDGALRATWSTSSLSPNYYTSVNDYSLGKLSAGTHTLRISTDSGGVVGESNESDNVYTKTITVSGGKPNLTPYQPAGWSDEIVVSTTTGTYTDSSGLTVDHNLYVDWAVLNNGSNAAGTFQTQLFVDGALRATWSTSSLSPNYYTSVNDYSLGKLSAGTHTLRISTDSGGVVGESNESDNVYTKTITVSGGKPNLAPYQPAGWSDEIVVSTSTGTHTDNTGLTVDHTLYVDWAILNNGSSAAFSFHTQLYVDGALWATWSTGSLGANYYTTVNDYSLGKLSAGTHTLRIKTDSGGVVGESNEGDNEYTKTIAVSGGKPNLAPYQPAGWSDEIVVSTTTGTHTDSTGLTPDSALFVDWAVLNNGSAPATTFHTQLYVDNVLRATWQTGSLGASYYTTVSDYSLGKLAAGTHTLKVKMDSGGAIAESNEADNEYTKTITIGGSGKPNLAPYQPPGWSDEIVVSTTTGTHADSTGLTPDSPLFVDWAVLNNGSVTATTFHTQLYVDNVLRATWQTGSLGANYYTTVSDYSLGKLAAGTHTLRVKMDSGGVIAESNEADNEFTKTITIGGSGTPNLAPYQPAGWSDEIVVSTTTGTHTDSTGLTPDSALFVDWAVVNNGSTTATTFHTQLYVDNVLRATWQTGSLGANYYTTVSDYSLGKLALGTHTLRIKMDSGGVIAESNEGDNEYTKTITIGGSGKPNLTPYQPPGWSDKIVVSTSSGTHSDSTNLTPDSTLYIDWAMLNSGTGTAVNFQTQLYVDGVLRATWPTGSLGATFSTTVSDYSLGKLSLGAHTLKIKMDAGGTVDETNEGDNEYTKSIAVVNLKAAAYRPTAIPFAKREIPEGEEETPGAGVRVNGDDDDGNGVADAIDVSPANENDLIELFLQIDPPTPPSGFSYVLTRSNQNIRVWEQATKGSAILDANNEAVLSFSSGSRTVWVENPSGGAADLQFIVRRQQDQRVLAADKIHFFAFTSVVIAVGGKDQQPADPPSGSHGTFEIALDLYKRGFDVHMYHEDLVSPNGQGEAFDEVQSAIQDRQVSTVAIFGYSHGGGSTADLASALNINRSSIGTFTIAYTAYIDAISHAWETDFRTEQELPASTNFHANYYQPCAGLLELCGGPIAGASFELDVSSTEWGAALDHGTIDDNGNVRNGVRDYLMQRVSR